MTPTEIEKINREFAEKCMRWTNLGGRAKCWMGKSVNFPSESLYTGYSDKADAADYFDPYHRWDHAAMGLEKMQQEGYEFWMHTFNGIYIRRYNAQFFFPGRFDERVKIDANTGPAAICMACIEAKK